MGLFCPDVFENFSRTRRKGEQYEFCRINPLVVTGRTEYRLRVLSRQSAEKTVEDYFVVGVLVSDLVTGSLRTTDNPVSSKILATTLSAALPSAI